MGLIDDVGSGPVALDTSAFIYYIEDHPSYADVVAPLFALAQQGRVQVVTSALTLLEVLVVPFRSDNDSLAATYEAVLTRGRGLELVPIDVTQLRAAAMLRAHTRLRTPDALQLSAAITRSATAFVTNDREFPSIDGLRLLQLASYVDA